MDSVTLHLSNLTPSITSLNNQLSEQVKLLNNNFQLPNTNNLTVIQNNYANTFNNYINQVSPIGLLDNTSYKLTSLKSIITPTTPKYSDILADATNIAPPLNLDYRPYLQPIRDQGPYGTCVAFGSTTILEFQLNINNMYNDYTSPAFIYLNKNTNTNEGMTLEEGLNILSTIGAPTEKEYPYTNISTSTNPIIYRNKSTINSTIYNEAKTKILISQYAVINSVQELKSALANNGPCLLGLPVYLDSKGYTPNIFWKPAGGSTTPAGGHCICVIGYDNNGFLFRNSWGVKYGNNGYNYFPYVDWGIQLDCWTPIPITPLPFLSTSPSKSPNFEPSVDNNSEDNNFNYLFLFLLIPIVIGLSFFFIGNKKNKISRFDSDFDDL